MSLSSPHSRRLQAATATPPAGDFPTPQPTRPNGCGRRSGSGNAPPGLDPYAPPRRAWPAALARSKGGWETSSHSPAGAEPSSRGDVEPRRSWGTGDANSFLQRGQSDEARAATRTAKKGVQARGRSPGAEVPGCGRVSRPPVVGGAPDLRLWAGLPTRPPLGGAVVGPPHSRPKCATVRSRPRQTLATPLRVAACLSSGWSRDRMKDDRCVFRPGTFAASFQPRFMLVFRG
jgi:hypothetical protein